MSRFVAYGGTLRASGEPRIGKVPAHWSVLALKRGAAIVNGSTPKSAVDGYWDGEVPWVTPADLSKVNGGYIAKGSRSLTRAGYLSCGTTLVPKGSLIVSTRAPIGTLALSSVELCTNQGCKSLIPSAFDPIYLRFSLSISTRALNVRGRGTTFLELSTEELGAFRVCVPPLQEQTQIAKFLDYETAKIDALIEKQQQLIALLKEKRQAVISHAVTKGLDPAAPMKDSGVEWLGKVPAHWNVGKCGFYLRVLSGYAFPSSGFSSSEADTRLLRGINVAVGGVRWDETVRWTRRAGDGLEAWELSEGDLVIGMDRPMISEGVRVAKLGKEDVPSLLLQRVASLQPSPRLNGDYLMRLLSFDKLFEAHFAPETTGVSVPHISPSQVSDFVIPIPPRGEQDAIVKELEQQVSTLDQLTDKAGAQTTLLQERRTALISAAVTGKIDVRGWKPPESEEQVA